MHCTAIDRESQPKEGGKKVERGGKDGAEKVERGGKEGAEKAL